MVVFQRMFWDFSRFQETGVAGPSTTPLAPVPRNWGQLVWALAVAAQINTAARILESRDVIASGRLSIRCPVERQVDRHLRLAPCSGWFSLGS